jgi:3-oxoadipate enol-lactonase
VVFAHRGFPPPSAVSGKSAPDSYADDLSALDPGIETGTVQLVAQSMGGWTCLDYALREPKKVRALVMASTSGVLDFSQLKDAEVDEWSRQSPGKLKDLQSRGIHPAGGERMAKEQPALAQLYGQISELASPAFRERCARDPRAADPIAEAARAIADAGAVRHRRRGLGVSAGRGTGAGEARAEGQRGARAGRRALGVLRARGQVQRNHREDL